jgi:hypothetical protein
MEKKVRIAPAQKKFVDKGEIFCKYGKVVAG